MEESPKSHPIWAESILKCIKSAVTGSVPYISSPLLSSPLLSSPLSLQLCSPFSLQLLPTNHLLPLPHTHTHTHTHSHTQSIIIGDGALAGDPFEHMDKRKRNNLHTEPMERWSIRNNWLPHLLFDLTYFLIYFYGCFLQIDELRH